jgi:uncharacterized membrane protein
MLKATLVALGSFIVLDGLWLGVVMNSFYRQELGPIARTAADGSLAPIWAAAAPVYLLLAIGIGVFVAPRSHDGSLFTAAAYGAVFGWLVFGVYDLTNLATLKSYSGLLTAVDIAWGGLTCGVTAMVVKKLAG